MDTQDIPWTALTVAAVLIIGGLVSLQLIRSASDEDGSEDDGPPPGPATRLLAVGGVAAGTVILIWALATSL